jgi:hypothetical protein
MYESTIITNASNFPIFTPCGNYLIGLQYKNRFTNCKVLYTYHISTKTQQSITSKYNLLSSLKDCLLSYCGRYLFMNSYSTLSIMNLTTCQITSLKYIFKEMPRSILFSPDEKCIYFLLNYTQKSTINCIYLKTEHVTTIYESDDLLDYMILSPDSMSLFVTNHTNDSIEKVSLTHGSILKTYDNTFPSHLLLSKCNTMLLFSSYKGRGIKSIDLCTNQQSYIVKSKKITKYDKFSISPDGKTLIASNYENIIKRPFTWSANLFNLSINFKKLQFLKHSYLPKQVVQDLLK